MTNPDPQQLIEKRNLLLKKVGKLKGLIRGTLVRTKKKCGRKDCRCEQGDLHPHVYISIYRKPRNKVVYIRPQEIEETQKGIQAYREVLRILDEISLINMTLVKTSGSPKANHFYDKNNE